MFKYTIPHLLQIVAKSYTWKVKTRDKKVFLTFDDGPHPQITPWVLQQLRQYQAKATFFCVGDNVRKFPDTYADILAQKHAVGNHTFHHVKGWNLSTDEYLEEVREASLLIHSPLFRPPYGRIKPAQAKKMKADYQLIMWDYLSRDFDPKLNREQSLNAMKKAGKGSIMVFHDSEKAFENLKFLLPRVLTFFSEAEYSFEALPYHK